MIVENYNLLTKTSDKVIYIVFMSIMSVICAICFVVLFTYTVQLIDSYTRMDFIFFSTSIDLTAVMSIFFPMCYMYMIAIIGGAKIIKVAINALCVSGFLVASFLGFPLLDSIFKFHFGFGWLLIGFGYFVLILPNILLLLNKIPIRIFLRFFFAVNILTFGFNLLTYVAWV